MKKLIYYLLLFYDFIVTKAKLLWINRAAIAKRIKYLLHHHDAIWSVPFAFVIFVGVGYILLNLFGLTVGTYDLGFLQPLFLAGCVVIGATYMAILGIRFNAYTIYKWGWGKKQADGTIKNIGKEDWRNITPIQRYIIASGLFIFFIITILWMYSKFI